MKVCRVKGCVVSTNKNEGLRGMKLMVVCEFNPLTGRESDAPYIAVDTVGAGQGEVVLVVGGSSSRQTEITENRPVDAVIVAIVDSIELEGAVVFKKYAGG